MDPRAAVVARYYEASARGDAAVASSLLSPRALSESERSVAEDWKNIVSVSQFHVDFVRSFPGDWQADETGFSDTTQVTVSVDLRYRDAAMSGTSDGRTIRFAYVGRGSDRNWRILSIGSGP
jgi:hypothetical protein